MRKLVGRLIYRKWFYAFLALVLWIDCWTDVATVAEDPRLWQIVSLVLSAAGALAVTLIFVDLHRQWPPEER